MAQGVLPYKYEGERLEFCHKDGGRDIREERGDLEEVGGVGFREKGITGRFSQEGSRG